MSTADLTSRATRFPQIHAQLTRREWLQIAAVGGGSLAAGLTLRSVAAQETPIEGGTWTMALAGNPTAYPITAPGALNDILVNKTIYNNLVQYQLVDNAIQVVPDLAESWEPNADASQYTFKLKSGITWHDGTPFTAADVVFTIESMLNPEVNASQRGNISRISTVEAPDDLTVVFTLSSPYADLPIMLGYNVGIVPKHLLEGQDLNEPTAFLQAPVGTGPFKYKEFSAGNFLSVEKNPDYFEGPAHLDSIVFKIIPDGNARVAQAQSGEIDLAIVEPPQVEAMNESDSATVREVPQVQYYFFAVNHTSPTMQNVLVRRALLTAIDKDAIVNELLGGYGAVCTGPINPLLADYYTSEVTTYPYDLEAAGALLDEAGWTLDGDQRVNSSGQPLTVVVNGPQGYPTLEQVLIYAQQQWQGLGVTVNLVIDEWTVHLEKYRTQDYDLLLNWWITPPTPDLFAHYHSTATSNWWKYSNPQVDDLILQGQAEIDVAARAEIYKQLQALLADDLPVLYLWYGRELQALSNRTQGLPAMGYRDALTWSEEIWVTE
jgi:peptide/nickel transport system substrate-binding protein